MQAQATVRCGVCRSRFDTVRELLDHGHTCEISTARATSVRETRRSKQPAAELRRHAGVTAGMVMASPAVTVRQDASLWTAWDLLYGASYRHIVVVEDHRRPLGVLDEQTITREWPPGPVGPHRQRAYDLIPGGVPPHVDRDDTMAAVAQKMLSADVDALPVVDGRGRLLGLVTTRHLAEFVADCA